MPECLTDIKSAMILTLYNCVDTYIPNI